MGFDGRINPTIFVEHFLVQRCYNTIYYCLVSMNALKQK